MKNSYKQDPQAIWRILGLAARAGQIASGVELIKNKANNNLVCLLWLATDAGPTSQERINRLAAQFQLPLIERGSCAELGHWIGRNNCAAVALLDQHMAARILELATVEHM
jgi:ribosomal protein L7Ae-like RNA K-turn-binding protein